MKAKKILKEKVPTLLKSVSLKEYFLDLFAARLNNASEEELLVKSQSWGRSEEEARRDLTKVENLCEAVGLFLDKALVETSSLTIK